MSTADAEVVIRDYIRSQGGAASAGAVVAHAATLGLAASTVRRAADRCVEKVRRGNRFVWTLVAADPEPDPITEGGETDLMDRGLLEARARHLGITLDPIWTETEIAALIEDVEDGLTEADPSPDTRTATWY